MNPQIQLYHSTFFYTDSHSIEIFQILSPTDQIVLNAMDLAINKSELIHNGQSYPTESVTFKAEQEIVILKFNQQFSGDALLNIEFIGELNDKMKGFYRSKYFAPTGEVRYAGVTQFEATDARRCFPCSYKIATRVILREFLCNFS